MDEPVSEGGCTKAEKGFVPPAKPAIIARPGFSRNRAEASDTDQAAKATRDPVAPAVRSKAALRKVHSRCLDDGTPTHSFATLLGELSTIVRNTCRTPQAGPEAPTFEVLTTPNAKQRRAFDLLQAIRV